MTERFAGIAATSKWVRGAIDALRQRPISHRIVFHHVPKCGGTSLTNAIEASFGHPRFGGGIHHVRAQPSTQAAELAGIEPAVLRDHLLLYFLSLEGSRYVGGHLRVNEFALDVFGSDWKFVSMVRHPVERWLSQYRYNRNKASEHHRTHTELAEFIESPEAESMGHQFVGYFGGEIPPEGPNSAAAFEKARANIDRLDLVGVLEDVDGFSKGFTDQFGVELQIPHQNRGPGADIERTPEVAKRIEQLCSADLALYDHVVESRGWRPLRID